MTPKTTTNTDMNRINPLALAIVGICALLFASCQKAPFVTMNGPRSYTFTDQGGKQSFSFSCNRDWRVSSSDSWIHVSPSSGTASDGEITVTITCDANTTYDPRKTTLTLKVEELTETIEVSQETNLGIIVSPKSYDLSSQAQAVEIEVQANVGYKISIDTSCKDWISEASTKGLTSTKHVFNISENKTYDNREGRIYIRQDGSEVAETITIKQSQVEAIILNENVFNIDCEGGVLTIPIKTNVDVTVSIPAEAQSWIKQIQTKALSDQEISLEIASNEGEDIRSAEVIFSGGKASVTITLRQGAKVSSEPIVFKDQYAKKACVEKWDKNGDGEFSYKEAAEITETGDGILSPYHIEVSSFDEFQFFTGITKVTAYAFNTVENMRSIVLPPNVTLIESFAFQACSSLKTLVIPESVTTLQRFALADTGVEYITIPETVKEIGNDQFYRCMDLMSIKGHYASEDERCLIIDGVLVGFAPKGLTTYTTPSGITKISSSMFSFPSSYVHNDILEELVISEGVESIDKDLPYGIIQECTRLRKITIPSSMKEINKLGTIRYYYSIYCKAIEPPTMDTGAFYTASNVDIYVPRESVEKYKEAKGWSYVANRIHGYDF